MKNKGFESSWHMVERSQLDIMLCMNGLRDLKIPAMHGSSSSS